MPNGGPDCCGNCSYNRAVQELAHPQPENRERFWEISYCTLRNVTVPDPFWTYCQNFEYGKLPELRKQDVIPLGWVTASGLYEGYVRIPWDGTNAPVVGTNASCTICGRSSESGITLSRNGQTFGFCTNRHYVHWWKTQHHDDGVQDDNFETPEQRELRLARTTK